MKIILNAMFLAASVWASATHAGASPTQPMLQISFGAESRLDVKSSGGITTIAGDRVTARIRDLQGSDVATIQADRSEILEGKAGATAVLLSGSPVVVGGNYVINAEDVQFDPATGRLVMTYVVMRTVEKSGGVLSYTCSGPRLYRNGDRVVGDEDIVPYTGSLVMVTRCRNGKPESTIMFRVQVP